MPAEVHVRGLRELQQAFKYAERDARLFVRAELRNVAEPIRREAETLAVSRIRRMPRSPTWSRMRIGVTRNLIYVAPRQRGVKQAGSPRARGYKFATLLSTRAMEPALDAHAGDVVHRMEAALDRMADHFNRGGIVT